MRNRVDKLGVTEPEIRTQGDDQIVIQLPGVATPRPPRSSGRPRSSCDLERTSCRPRSSPGGETLRLKLLPASRRAEGSEQYTSSTPKKLSPARPTEARAAQARQGAEGIQTPRRPGRRRGVSCAPGESPHGTGGGIRQALGTNRMTPNVGDDGRSEASGTRQDFGPGNRPVSMRSRMPTSSRDHAEAHQ
jgi:hypothetical protein